MKDLSVIIVNYNVSYFLEQCLLSVRRAAQKLRVEVFVVDNNSVDGSVEMVQRRFPEVILLANKENLGFSKANNQAIRQAQGKYVLLLNPDTVVEEDTFLKCFRFMEANPAAGALGVKMMDGAGKFLPESKRGLPTPWVAFSKVFGLAALFPASAVFNRYHLGHLPADEVHKIDILAGAFMFMRAEALQKVGLLDEDFFMYGEDIDLSYRIKEGGFDVYYFPETRIIHYKGESTRKTSVNYVFMFYRAMMVFAEKHFSGRQARLYSLLIRWAIYLRAALALLFRGVKQVLPLLLDGLCLVLGALLGEKVVPDPLSLEVSPMWGAYLAVWLGTAFFSGAYDQPTRLYRLVRGMLWGSILLMAFSSIVSVVGETNKKHLLVAVLVGLVGMTLWRLVWHFKTYGHWRFGEPKAKRIAVVGSDKEVKRASNLLRQAGAQEPLARLEPQHTPADLRQIREVIEIYKINELIFCGKDLAVSQIIEWMVQIHNSAVEFKILPENSAYIIGSSSKNAPGDYYALHIEVNLLNPYYRRNKAVLNSLVSALLLVLSPFLIWRINRKRQFLKNCLGNLVGVYQWVGLKATATPESKPAILSPVDKVSGRRISPAAARQMEVIYAKDYTPYADLLILSRNISNLGRSA
ncbi:glycosyltransferase family 2 protein [Rufibacter sediminis]|uniref:Glycosyltransferase n=1 Tax=Rufibacter sediminis TaxID=2762756 RepID=A0ABR6VZ04_9BACT|nr:glycosyltransferase family 2 protein [Rufibacter sediminis]MBC3542419.1 glycosyltransferase [Rufibacter sediminis]